MTNKRPNWAEAPADATHAGQDLMGVWRWYRINPSRDDMLILSISDKVRPAGVPSDLTLIPRPAAQPEAPTWDGESLPPVGAQVEFTDDSASDDWGTGTVIGYDGEWTVVSYGRGGPYYPRAAHLLRPIVTAEQRAAKERDEAVTAMCKAVESRPDVQHANSTLDASVAIRVAIEALYDLGARLPETD